LSGAIFDPEPYRVRLKALEERSSDPNFWSNQEEAQNVLKERKRAEAQLAADAKLASIRSDLETYIELAKGETNAQQKEELLKDLQRELTAADAYVSELETQTLLSGENDHLNAIMTIKPKRRALRMPPSNSPEKMLMGCWQGRRECTGWCAFRHSIRRRGGTLRSLQCS
jgi:hypothetical protein